MGAFADNDKLILNYVISLNKVPLKLFFFLWSIGTQTNTCGDKWYNKIFKVFYVQSRRPFSATPTFYFKLDHFLSQLIPWYRQLFQ